MTEETPTPEINDTLTMDDMDMLRAVLEDSHSRGITPVSVYNQSEHFTDIDEAV